MHISKIQLQKKKVGQNWIKISAIKGGGIRRLMANAIKNFHIFWEPFPFLTPWLSQAPGDDQLGQGPSSQVEHRYRSQELQQPRSWTRQPWHEQHQPWSRQSWQSWSWQSYGKSSRQSDAGASSPLCQLGELVEPGQSRHWVSLFHCRPSFSPLQYVFFPSHYILWESAQHLPNCIHCFMEGRTSCNLQAAEPK